MSLLSEQEAYWDGVAEIKEFPTPFNTELFEKYVSKDKAVLDLGCGYGRITNVLFNSGFRKVVGIDFSSQMIDRGLRQYPHLNLKKFDGDSIPYGDGSFCSVILVAVLTCISESLKQSKLISEIERVLKPGGIIYVHDCLLNQDRRNIDRYKKFENKHGQWGIFELPEGAVLRHHSKDYISELLNGFEKIAFEECRQTTMNGHRVNGFWYIGRKKGSRL